MRGSLPSSDFSHRCLLTKNKNKTKQKPNKVPSFISIFLESSHILFYMSSSNWTILVWSVLSLCQATSFWKNECPTISWFSSIAWNDSHIPCCHCWARKHICNLGRAPQGICTDVFHCKTSHPSPERTKAFVKKHYLGTLSCSTRGHLLFLHK